MVFAILHKFILEKPLLLSLFPNCLSPLLPPHLNVLAQGLVDNPVLLKMYNEVIMHVETENIIGNWIETFSRWIFLSRWECFSFVMISIAIIQMVFKVYENGMRVCMNMNTITHRLCSIQYNTFLHHQYFVQEEMLFLR